VWFSKRSRLLVSRQNWRNELRQVYQDIPMRKKVEPVLARRSDKHQTKWLSPISVDAGRQTAGFKCGAIESAALGELDEVFAVSLRSRAAGNRTQKWQRKVFHSMTEEF